MLIIEQIDKDRKRSRRGRSKSKDKAVMDSMRKSLDRSYNREASQGRSTHRDKRGKKQLMPIELTICRDKTCKPQWSTCSPDHSQNQQNETLTLYKVSNYKTDYSRDINTETDHQ